MGARKIQDKNDARECIARMKKSGFAVAQWARSAGKVTESGCNAHGRRKFRDAEETQPVLAVEGGEFIGAMYGEEEKAQQLGLTGPALLDIANDSFVPLRMISNVGLTAVEPTLLPSETVDHCGEVLQEPRRRPVRFH